MRWSGLRPDHDSNAAGIQVAGSEKMAVKGIVRSGESIDPPDLVILDRQGRPELLQIDQVRLRSCFAGFQHEARYHVEIDDAHL